MLQRDSLLTLLLLKLTPNHHRQGQGQQTRCRWATMR
jgi:hypothetical protein